MKKKLLKSLLIGIISCTIPIALTPITAGAATITQDTVDNKGSTPISANVSESYTITIPDAYDFGTVARGTGLTYTAAGTISAADVTIGSDKTLNVKIDSSTTFTIANSNSNTIAYDIYDSNTSTTPTSHTDPLLSALSGATPTKDYYLGLDKANVNNPGTYSGSIVFVVSIDNTTP